MYLFQGSEDESVDGDDDGVKVTKMNKENDNEGSAAEDEVSCIYIFCDILINAY